MRIGIDCLVLGSLPSGVEYYVLGLVQNIVQLDQQNEYVLFVNPTSALQERLPKWNHVTVHAVRWARAGRLSRIAWEQLHLPSAARFHHLDVLHCPAYVCPIAKSVPYVVTVHDTLALDHPEWCKRFNAVHYRCVLRRTLTLADRLIAVSRASATAVLRHAPHARRRLDVVYPGVDEIFRPSVHEDAGARVRRTYRLPQRFVLFVGNIEPRKNLIAMLKAFGSFRRNNHAEYWLVIVGGKSWREGALRRALARQSSRDHVLWVGYVPREDLPAIYSLAELFVFPSLYEGFGFPPLEAMACGVPVVASSRGALDETLRDAAFRVDPESSDAIAEGMLAVTHDDHLRRRLIDAGHRRAKRLTWRRAVRRTLRSYWLAHLSRTERSDSAYCEHGELAESVL
ncbi:MAG TPA: glycosyltransferase family 1 protein [Phycisphaerae bacterium]|nr:glycosyltransferase family 1 protein [Phycisphaerae bacterium]